MSAPAAAASQELDAKMLASESKVPIEVPENEVVQSFPPSHILQDGRFIYLPPPSDAEKSKFFERSIGRHGLLEDDLAEKKKPETEDEASTAKREAEPKVHPLALASARLQSNGTDELNRVINLSTLVQTGEYFGLSNIVDPSLEIATTAPAAPETKSTEPASSSSAAVQATQPESASDMQEEQSIKAFYVLKRKRAQFEKASTVLSRHQRRLAAAIVAEARPDARLRQLRPQWRLVAPEHGTRALPHAARPTEVVAVDIDVYWKGGSTLGRLASRVPRYATMELKDDYEVQPDLEKWEEEHSRDENAMEVDTSEGKPEDTADEVKVEKDTWTRAEPFAIADPTLGKIDADFDPKKVAMLTLKFEIEKSSTGFCQSACLKPIPTVAVSQKGSTYQEDEKVLVALQHSLFCSKLFESVRRELAPDTEEVGQVRSSFKAQSVVWLSSQAEQNFLPPPNLMAGGDGKSGLAPLCVIHCHEGEVKVQLDCEYTLRVTLVEAGETLKAANGMDIEYSTKASGQSGSQSPAQLLALCRALLLHAQESYHKHSLRAADVLHKQEEQQKATPGVVNLKKVVPAPHILQSCVSLGTKMLFERRVRKALIEVNQWLKSTMHTGERLQVEWLPLSIFDLHSQFTLVFRSYSFDASIVCDEVTITSFGEDGDYGKVKFHSDAELELFLKGKLRRLIKKESSFVKEDPSTP